MKVERGERSFAEGDRLMFLRNERSMGVKNGTLGTVEAVTDGALTVRLDDRRQVAFDLKDYSHFDHGYAATIHKAQGVTVDRAHVLATPGLDRHAAYVALTRHRDAVAVHYGAADFKDGQALAKTLGRERAKDTTLDYDQAFAERRGIAHTVGSPQDEIRVSPELAREATPARKKGRFDGLKLGMERAPELAASAPKEKGRFSSFRPKPRTPEAAPVRNIGQEMMDGVLDYARAYADAERMGALGLPVLAHQTQALKEAGAALASVVPQLADEARAVFSRTPGLAASMEQPDGMARGFGAILHEGEVRRSPELRAARFVETWRGLEAQRERLSGWEHADARKAVEVRMKGLAEGLGRDPQVESILRNKRQELGLGQGGSRPIGEELTRSLGRDRGMER